MWERRPKKRSLYSRGSSCQRTCPRCVKNQSEFTVIDTAIALTEKWQRVSAPRFKYLRQGISLTGLGTPTFANALDAAQEIYKQFDRQFEEGILDHWACSSANDMFPSIDVSNRYLTPAREAGGIEETPFLKGVDPKGILQNMANGDGTVSYVHTEDNQVQYFSMQRDADENRKSVLHKFHVHGHQLTYSRGW